MSRCCLARLRIVTNENVDTRTLSTEFPSIQIACSRLELVHTSVIDAEAWRTATTFRPFDDLAERVRGDHLVIRGEADVAAVAGQVLTRYQRFIDRRNGASARPTFDVVIRAHRAIHEERRSLGNGDLTRALDTWQWLLRLDPEAPLVVQLVALFRGVERIEVEPLRRAEPRLVASRIIEEERHADFGGERTFNILRAAGFDETTASRVRRLVAQDELLASGPGLDALRDAEGLSFLSLGSSVYFDCYGRDQARRRIAHTLRHLSPAARAKLELVRFRPDVFSVVRDAA
jgi:hypothetical protein